MGGFLALISRGSVFKVRRREETCIDCKACDRSCPVNIAVSARATVHDWECINCNQCVNSCPVQDTLVISSRRKRTLRPGAVLWGTVAIITVVIAATSATGSFTWQLQDIGVEAREAGSFDPNLITGRNSLREIAEASGVPLRLLQETFAVPDEALDKALKDIKDTYGFDTEAIREFVADRLGGGD
jgi:NAD-dependent dihydropyrimidine dehydrogenase PreA subunit